MLFYRAATVALLIKCDYDHSDIWGRNRGVEGANTKLGRSRAVYVSFNVFVNHLLCRREDRRIKLQNN